MVYFNLCLLDQMKLNKKRKIKKITIELNESLRMLSSL